MTQQGEGTCTKWVCLSMLIFLGLGGVIGYTSGVIDLEFLISRPTLEEPLSSMVSIRGSLKFEDLHLSRSEVRKINSSIFKNRDVFKHMNLTLDLADEYAPKEVEEGTQLVMALMLEADSDCEVLSWERKLSRRDLVPQLVRYMAKAAQELVHYRNSPELKRGFRRIYI